MNSLYKRNIKFDGTKEIETKNKNKRDNIIARRFRILMGFVICVAFIFLIQMFNIQIKNEDYYDTKLDQYNSDLLTADTFRGNIYDRDGNRLVYNKNVSCATYYAVKNIKEKEIDLIIKFLIDNIDIDISKVSTRDKKDYLIALAGELGVADKVHLLGYRRDIPELNYIADVFCFPSLREGLGLAPIEALNSGLPVVAARNRGTCEFVVHILNYCGDFRVTTNKCIDK